MNSIPRHPKYFLIVALTTGIVADTIAQKDTSSGLHNNKRAIYDKSSIYYNKDKLIINVGTGYDRNATCAENYLDFNAQPVSVSPAFCLNLDYGESEKRSVGLGISFLEVKDQGDEFIMSVPEKR